MSCRPSPQTLAHILPLPFPSRLDSLCFYEPSTSHARKDNEFSGLRGPFLVPKQKGFSRRPLSKRAPQGALARPLLFQLTLWGRTIKPRQTAGEPLYRVERQHTRVRQTLGKRKFRQEELGTKSHWPRGKKPISRFRVVRVFPLILHIVFDIVLCHYLLLFCHSIIPLFVVNSLVCYKEPLGSDGNKTAQER